MNLYIGLICYFATEIIDENMDISLKKDNEELIAILVSIIKTLKKEK